MKTKVLIAAGILLLLVAGFMVVKKVSPVGWNWWGNYNSTSGVALKGYDPVAYFDNGVAKSGNNQHSYEWGGVTWQFSSAEHRDLFASRPEQFAPQFGGFCSFAVSKGFTADISPDAWHIENGQLYVFADENVRNDWIAAIDDGSLEKSERNWQKR